MRRHNGRESILLASSNVPIPSSCLMSTRLSGLSFFVPVCRVVGPENKRVVYECPRRSLELKELL